MDKSTDSTRNRNEQAEVEMSEELLAPLAGTVIQIDIQIGQPVEEDDDALVIEAMKMETRVYVPCNGTIREIRVKQGDKVEEDDVLAVIETA
jgi:acetyl-CoA carboxylase biotin carboxyl carrier protein